MTSPDRHRGRLTAFYVALGLVVLGAIGAVAIGADSAESQPAIGGGYDVTAGADCLGAQFTVVQSGQFVRIVRADDEVAGKPRLRDGRLTGEVTCADGKAAQIDLRPVERGLTGTIGGEQFDADLKRDPPPPGVKPLVPDAIDGEYALTPPSACLPAKIALEEHDGALEVEAGGKAIGEVEYADGEFEGTVRCRDG